MTLVQDIQILFIVSVAATSPAVFYVVLHKYCGYQTILLYLHNNITILV